MIKNYNDLKSKYNMATVAMALQNLISVGGQAFTDEDIDKAYRIEKEKHEKSLRNFIISPEESLLIMKCSKEISELDMDDIVYLIKKEFSSSYEQNIEELRRERCIAISRQMLKEQTVKSENMYNLIYLFNESCDDFKIVPLPDNLYVSSVALFDMNNSIVSEAYTKVEDLVTILKVVLDISDEEFDNEIEEHYELE